MTSRIRSATVRLAALLALALCAGALGQPRVTVDLRSVVEIDGRFHALAFHPDGSHLVAGDWDGTIRRIDVATGEVEAVFEAHEGIVTTLAFSDDGELLASGSSSGGAAIWDLSEGVALERLEIIDIVMATGFLPESHLMVTGAAWGPVQVWDADTGAVAEELGDVTPVSSVAFRPRARNLVYAGDFIEGRNTIQVWDTREGVLVEAIETGHDDTVTSLAFDPTGTLLASASVDWTVEVRDMETGERIARMTAHEDEVASVDFDPMGRILASGGEDGNARLWEARTGRQLAVLEHEGTVIAVAFSSAGVLATSSYDGTVRLWDVRWREP